MDSIPKEILDERFYKNTYMNTIEFLTDMQAEPKNKN